MKNYSNEIAELQLLIEGVRKESAELQKSNNLKVKQVLDSHFNPFSELDIQVLGTSASFYMKDNLEVRREVFNLYFYERFRGETLLDLSYYTTSECSEFELERLMNLGKVAKVVLEKSEQILKDISEARKSDLIRSTELYSIQSGYERTIQEYKNAEKEGKKVEIELSLKGEGVVFDKIVSIDFKRNYSVRLLQMKMIDISKSGKTCTITFVTQSGYKGREENCNVERMIDQVMYFHNNIVQELLPA